MNKSAQTLNEQLPHKNNALTTSRMCDVKGDQGGMAQDWIVEPANGQWCAVPLPHTYSKTVLTFESSRSCWAIAMSKQQ